MSVGFNYYLLHVSATGFEGGASEGEGTEESTGVYMKAGHLIQLDSYLCTHGPCSQLQGWSAVLTSIACFIYIKYCYCR